MKTKNHKMIFNCHLLTLFRHKHPLIYPSSLQTNHNSTFTGTQGYPTNQMPWILSRPIDNAWIKKKYIQFWIKAKRLLCWCDWYSKKLLSHYPDHVIILRWSMELKGNAHKTDLCASKAWQTDEYKVNTHFSLPTSAFSPSSFSKCEVCRILEIHL